MLTLKGTWNHRTSGLLRRLHVRKVPSQSLFTSNHYCLLSSCGLCVWYCLPPKQTVCQKKKAELGESPPPICIIKIFTLMTPCFSMWSSSYFERPVIQSLSYTLSGPLRFTVLSQLAKQSVNPDCTVIAYHFFLFFNPVCKPSAIDFAHLWIISIIGIKWSSISDSKTMSVDEHVKVCDWSCLNEHVFHTWLALQGSTMRLGPA